MLVCVDTTQCTDSVLQVHKRSTLHQHLTARVPLVAAAAAHVYTTACLRLYCHCAASAFSIQLVQALLITAPTLTVHNTVRYRRRMRPWLVEGSV
jgi:hypothetical protein